MKERIDRFKKVLSKAKDKNLIKHLEEKIKILEKDKTVKK